MNHRASYSLCITLLFCCFLFCSLPIQALAAGEVDTTKATSLKLSYQYGSEILDNVNVRVYRVADMSNTASFTLSGDFVKYQTLVNLKNMTNQAKWTAAAKTLEAYIVADKISPMNTKQSDSHGEVVFDKVNTTGLYLVVADRCSKGNYDYTFAPFLISLPNLDAKDNWLYQVAAYPKSERKAHDWAEKEYYTDYKVVKHWMDSGLTSERPKAVTVEILRDGNSFAVQTLSSENNWTYSWQVKNDKSDWQVVERNIQGPYTVTTTQNANTFLITNTYTQTSHIPDGPIPGGGIDGGSDGGSTEDGGSTGNKEEDPTTEITDDAIPGSGADFQEEKTNTLPQTGQLWWPIPWLAGCGVILFGAGWAMNRKGETDETK